MMRLIRSPRLTVLVLYALLPIAGIAGSAAGANELPAVKEAIIRYLCHEVFWEERDYRTGVPLFLEVRMDATRFFAWVQDITGGPRNRMSASLAGSIGPAGAAVTLLTAYTENVAGRPPGYARDRRHFAEASVIRDTVTIPPDCTPHFDAPTPRKNRMLATVISTLEMQLGHLKRAGIWRGPDEVTLTIADFNVDDPVTYVLVDPPGEMHLVRLHNPQDYESDEYERMGMYPISDVLQPFPYYLLPKVRKYGIVRRIHIAP